jgi:hypothetical protein
MTCQQTGNGRRGNETEPEDIPIEGTDCASLTDQKKGLLPENKRHVRAKTSPSDANAGRDTESSQAENQAFGNDIRSDARSRKEWL